MGLRSRIQRRGLCATIEGAAVPLSCIAEPGSSVQPLISSRATAARARSGVTPARVWREIESLQANIQLGYQRIDVALALAAGSRDLDGTEGKRRLQANERAVTVDGNDGQGILED